MSNTDNSYCASLTLLSVCSPKITTGIIGTAYLKYVRIFVIFNYTVNSINQTTII